MYLSTLTDASEHNQNFISISLSTEEISSFKYNTLRMTEAATRYIFKHNDARTFVSLLHCHPGKLKLWLALKI